MRRNRITILCLVLLASTINYSLAKETKKRTYTGRVIDYNARPVEGATVACYGYLDTIPLGRAQTTSKGRFSLQVETEETRPSLVAYKEGLALAWTEVHNIYEPIIRLGRPSMFKGIVVNETGQPVTDVMVRICLKHEMMALDDIAPLIPEGWFTAKTNAKGEFIFNNIPQGATADFGVEAPGRASIWTFCDFGLREGEQFVAGRTNIRIVLPPAGSIKGQVVDEHNDQAVAGVSVAARPYNSRVGWNFRKASVQTDPNGQFEITRLAPDKYLLRAISYEGGSGRFSVTVKAGQTIHDVQINLIKGVPLEVMVHDAEKGGPLEDAFVDVTQNSDTPPYSMFEQRATTDANGLARLSIPPGEYEVKVSKRDFGITFQSHKVQIEKGKTLRHEVSLPRSACIISGQVLDGQGQAISNALVMYKSWGQIRALTDANGRFEMNTLYISRLPSRVRLLVRHVPSGMAAAGEFEDPTRSGKLNGRIVLKPAYVLSGRVTDPFGRCIPAVYVKLLLEGPPTGAHSRPLAEVITDVNGVYSISSVPPPLDDLNDAYVIAVYAEGFGTNMVRQIPFHNDTSKPVQIEPIILQPANETISGIVTDSNDQPVDGVLVSVYGPRLSERYGQAPCAKILTDSQGRFHIAGVPKETLWIQTYAPNRKSGQTWALGGSENVKVILGEKLIFSPSLIGKPLPDLKDLKVDLSSSDLNEKIILVCFFDMEQRPSRHCIMQLAKRAQELKAKDIVVVAVQVSKIDENTLNEWIKKYNIPFYIATIQADIEKTRFTCGVRSLPWFILTDRQHIVRAEGFNLSELDEKIKETEP